MNIWSYLRWLLLLLLLMSCANIEPPVTPTVTSSPPSPTLTASLTPVPTNTPSPTPTETPISTPELLDSPIDITSLSGKILFSDEGDIFVMNADGTGRAQITDHPADDFDPVWSPDGTQIAFRTHRDGDEEVYLMNADGSDPRNLSNAPHYGDYSPAWSPNGEWIAFMSDRAGNNNIWVIRPDGSGLRQVTDIPGISEYPSWSPDSSRIVFNCTFGRRLSTGSGDFEICVVNFDGTELIQLTDTPGSNKFPAWSPDGTRVTFESDRDGWPSLPDYVPLGYESDDFGDSEIYIMNIDGAGQINLTNNPREGDTFPAWSRDGYLVFSRYGCLMIMKDDGSGEAPLGSCSDGGHFPDWYQPAPTSGITPPAW